MQNYAHFISGQIGIIPLSLGTPGCAKTASHIALAEKMNRQFIDFRLTKCIPEDLQGFPYREKGVTKYAPDERLKLATSKPCIVLLDEFGSLREDTQAAALAVLENGLKPSLVFACGNPIDCAAFAHELAPPVINRIMVRRWKPDWSSWEEGMVNSCNFPMPDVPIVPKNWKDDVSFAALTVKHFLDIYPDYREVNSFDNWDGNPFPSMRSWHHVALFQTAVEATLSDDDVIQTTLNDGISGLVGKSAAAQYLQWASDQTLPSPEEVLKDPHKIEYPHGSKTVAIAKSVCKWCKIHVESNPELWYSFRDFCCALWEQGHKEVAMLVRISVVRRMPDDIDYGKPPKAWSEMIIESEV